MDRPYYEYTKGELRDEIDRLTNERDTAWNDAIETAAELIECDGDAMGGKSGAAAAIRALRREKVVLAAMEARK